MPHTLTDPESKIYQKTLKKINIKKHPVDKGEKVDIKDLLEGKGEKEGKGKEHGKKDTSRQGNRYKRQIDRQLDEGLKIER